MNDKNKSSSFIKKLLILGASAIALTIIIRRLVSYYMETMQKISGISEGKKEYTAKFESKEYKPSCSFKGGGLRAMFSALKLDLADLQASEDISITCNAIGSAIEIIVPNNVNVITTDVSKLCAVHNAALAPFDSEKKTINVYISGFSSAIVIKNA